MADLSLAEAAAALDVSVEVLAAAVAAACEEAERPTANMCTLPGPALEVAFPVAERTCRAARKSESAADAWRVAIG